MPSTDRALSALCLPLRPLRPLLTLLGAAPAATAADGWSVAPSGGGRPACCAEGAPGAVLQDTALGSARFVPWGASAGAGGAMPAGGAFFVVRRRGCRGLGAGRGDEGGAMPEVPWAEAELTGATT
ncbi:hypothetical protein AB0H86_19910 [Streptomyces sp. NPDC050997]|uniref:hypothetical protein n=1 Tax=Streptomyces sp. NPDC050997 TaxID=3155519 RepID=UPI003449793F